MVAMFLRLPLYSLDAGWLSIETSNACFWSSASYPYIAQGNPRVLGNADACPTSHNRSNGYLSLRECAALCLNDAETYVDVRSFIGCPAQPYGQNECYCREDLHISASSYITHCVTSACGPGTVDVDGAVSVYDNYCFTAVGATPVIGAVAATTTNPAGTTAGQTFTPTSNGAVETGENTQSTGDPGSSSTNGKELTESNKIALGVGIGFGIPSVIGVIIACVNCMHRY
ncbi:uncharacterized protein K444DRAFT_623336 [Hyaloscypha bicolor E]|uniref:WSC domain-containing protein n=1 Tax=Hyaloscypha bicolor E TaxID=1095630 RepID=A0A2J6TVV7_9HELO|nr:uncharacterized protein K444DRAFT_623336 [Hyaloscypha bicolor E]PMD67121.1 hypothetical protein K444DRAFT_623336 [Hyaloscypha bicolor E]